MLIRPPAKLLLVAAPILILGSQVPLVGDVDLNGTLTAVDALAVLSEVVGKTLPEGWHAGANGDANCDGSTAALDALLVLSAVVGKDVSAFCVGGPVTVGSVTVGPGALALRVGRTATLAGVASDPHGRPLGGFTFAWSSSDTSVVAVDASGAATARALGSATVTASAADTAGTGTVSVVSDSAASVFDLSKDAAVTAFGTGLGTEGDTLNARIAEVGRGIAVGDVASSQNALVQARTVLNDATATATGDAVVLLAALDLVLDHFEAVLGPA